MLFKQRGFDLTKTIAELATDELQSERHVQSNLTYHHMIQEEQKMIGKKRRVALQNLNVILHASTSCNIKFLSAQPLTTLKLSRKLGDYKMGLRLSETQYMSSLFI
jgi:hypothetical protein